PVARAQPSPLMPLPPGTPPTQATPAPPTVEQLAERLRALEATNKALTGQLEQLNRQHAEQVKQLHERVTALAPRGGDGQAGQGLPNGNGVGAVPPGSGASPVPDYTEGGFVPFAPAPGYPESNVTNPNRFPLRASFGPGFLLQSDDDRFRLQIH